MSTTRIVTILVVVIGVGLTYKFLSESLPPPAQTFKTNPVPMADSQQPQNAPKAQSPSAVPSAAEPQAPINPPVHMDKDPSETAESEYAGRTAKFLALKESIATSALSLYASARGIQLHAPIRFYDFTLTESTNKLVTFDTSPNENDQEMIVVTREGSDFKRLFNDFLSDRSISLGDLKPQPSPVNSSVLTIKLDQNYIAYVESPGRNGYAVIVIVIQKNPFTPEQINSVKRSL